MYYTSWLKNLSITTTSFQPILLAYLQSHEEFSNTQGDVMRHLEYELYVDLSPSDKLMIFNFLVLQVLTPKPDLFQLTSVVGDQWTIHSTLP